MLSIGLNIGGRQKLVDLHSLPIGDTFAHKLPGPDLYGEMRKLKIKNIHPSFGWQQLVKRLPFVPIMILQPRCGPVISRGF
jgi:hypothetical protein